MRRTEDQSLDNPEKTVRDIRRATRQWYFAQEKIRIVLEGLLGEYNIAELCRKEGINRNLYHHWSKEFLEAGKKRLAGDTARQANSDQVGSLRSESSQLKQLLAEEAIEKRVLKKKCSGMGRTVFEIRGLREARAC